MTDPELEIIFRNIVATVRAGHMTEREGFDYYKAYKDGDTEKAEAMRKGFWERLNKPWDCTGF